MNRPSKRVDVLSKVTGEAKYADDIQHDDMVYGAVVRSPHSHAKIVNIDPSEARRYPGVLEIITAEDIPGIPSQPKQKPMLVPEIVRYIGEGVAVVIAESTKIAREAAKLVKVEYEVLESIYRPEEALKEGALELHEGGNVLVDFTTRKGNIEEEFAKADIIIEREYSTQREDHAFIETEAVVAEPTLDGITIYAPVNSVYDVRQTISETLGVNANEVRVKNPAIGGSFGGKNYDSIVQGSRAALGALKTGRPCKLVYTREESIETGTKRHPYKFKYRAGLKKDGTILAVEVDGLGDAGAYMSKSFPVGTRSAIEAVGPYRVKSSKSNIILTYTNNVYSDAMRGFGSPQVDFASEVFWDEVAKELGMSPYEFKEKNYLREGDISGVGQRMESVSIEECLRVANEEIPWEERRKEVDEFNEGNEHKKRGLGLGLMHRGEAFGAAGQGLDTAAVSVKTEPDGSVTILASVAEVGMGGHTMLVNIVREALGIDPKRIRVSPTDTDFVPNSGPTVATRGALVPGNACYRACEQIKSQYAEVVADKLDVDEDTIVFKDERVYSEGNLEEYMTYVDVVALSRSRGNSGNGHGWFTVSDFDWDGDQGTGEAYLCYVYGVCIVEVEINLGTGKVDVVDVTQVNDVGHAFDEEAVLGQINGGLVMGLGYGLMEELDMVEGKIKDLNLDQYLIPTSLDTPDLKTRVVEVPGPYGPFGAKGLGEPTACVAAPAVVNAVADAIGVYIRDIPANLESVLKETQ